MKTVLAVSTAYALQRKAFGKHLAEFGLIKQKLALMCARTFSLESMVYRLAAAMDAEFAPIDASSAKASDQYHRAAEEYSIECDIVKVLPVPRPTAPWRTNLFRYMAAMGIPRSFLRRAHGETSGC